MRDHHRVRRIPTLAALLALLLTAACTSSSDDKRPTGPRWQPRPGTDWQWQLSGRLDPSVDVPVYDIDGFDHSAQTVADLPPLPAPRVPSEAAQHNPLDMAWDAQKYPVHVSWLPGFLNQRMNRSLQRMHDNLAAMRGPGDHSAIKARLLNQVLAALPGTMFFMLPAFALLLKVMYLFRRRLYVEHLIVALHSHAFLFLCLLLGVLFQLLSVALEPHASWLSTPLGWLINVLWIWAPIYLLMMQKRVYRQGWPMTVLKYLVTGWCYCWLLAFAILGAAAMGLAE